MSNMILISRQVPSQVLWADRAAVADVRLLPTGALACAGTGMAVTPTSGVQGTTVSTHGYVTGDLRVPAGDFWGSPAWSPPSLS